MLIVSRQHLAANLAAYGESEASAKVAAMSDAELDRVHEIGYRHALAGEHLSKASCMAAVEVLEGAPRPLKRRRRAWTDVPADLLEKDALQVDIERWFASYAGGVPVDGRGVLEALSSALAPSLPGFRYYKTYRHFRAAFEHGASYIGLERGFGVVSLRFGVTHTEVEGVRGRLFEGVTPSAYPRPWTISKFTPNMGPTSPHWPYPVRPEWPVSGSDGLTRACAEIVAFVDDIALPYVIAHRDPAHIRDTLVNRPGQADGLADAQTVFAIDCLLQERAWLDSDYAHFSARYARFVASSRDALERDYNAAVRSWDAAP